MEERPNALLLKFPGTNCDEETQRALGKVGFAPRTVPITRVTPAHFDAVQLAVLSGGFSYGDYIMAARLAQLEIENRLVDTLSRFRDRGGYLLGICNGFQILTRLGLLPRGSLIQNESGRFICRWVRLCKQAQDSPFLTGLPDEFELPIAHAEGRFVTHREAEAEAYLREGFVALTYAEDVNGSYAGIAGLQDSTRRVFGLMPHPERFVSRHQHYDRDWAVHRKRGWGHLLFQSIYETVTRGVLV